MKAVRIEFVPPNAWTKVWAVAALAASALAVHTTVRIWQLHEQGVALASALLATQERQHQALQARQRAASQAALDPRAAQQAAAQRLMRRDWNRLFDTIERPALAQARLLRLTVDASAGTGQLAFEFDTLDQAQAMTRSLNGADPRSEVWQLEQLGAETHLASAGMPRVRATWRAILN